MLSSIRNTKDLRSLSVGELEQLAGEVRERIIEVVSERGGHLASNLGVVELTIALDRVFDCGTDRIIFDVGHQIYAHKLLTGRQERFAKLRERDGASGFSSIGEDPSDSFTAGHASTSISAALGYARARDIRGGKENVVAVIGDGALTGGEAFEALNDAGQSRTGLIVILNDNEMSISKNVGAISAHLTKMRRAPVYLRFKRRTRAALSRANGFGSRLLRLIERIRDTLKTLLIGGNVFDEMGFTYIGPVDGHDLPELLRMMELVRGADKPVVLHVLTQKGRGYRPAEEHPEKYHGAAPFYVENGALRGSGSKTYGEAACEELCGLAEARGDICVVTAAMTGGTGMSAFEKAHPERFWDVGIAEEHAVTMSGGLAAAGMKPYVSIYSTFLQRAYDQISNDICVNALPVTFLLDRAGLVGADGMTHNGVFDLSYLRSIPNMTLAAPRDEEMLRRLLRWSAAYNKPLAIRYPRSADAPVIRSRDIELGKWDEISRGSVQIIAVGRMVNTALRAAELLNGEGISTGVTDAIFVKPMDAGYIAECAMRARLIVTVEENVLNGGFGEGVTRAVADIGIRVPVVSLGVPDSYIAHATIAEQLSACGLDAESIAKSIAGAVNGK